MCIGRKKKIGKYESEPGSNGHGAIFTCPQCGSEFVRTDAYCPNCHAQLFAEREKEEEVAVYEKETDCNNGSDVNV